MDVTLPPVAAPNIVAWERAQALHLHERMGWLVQLRWYAAAAALAVSLAAYAIGAVPDPSLLIAGVVVLALGNAAVRAYARATPEDPLQAPRTVRLIIVQLVFDHAILTFLLQGAGGSENPFVLLYVLPTVMAAILLRLGHALFVAVAACVLHAVVALGELTGLIEHSSIHLGGHASSEVAGDVHLWASPAYIGAHLAAFVLTQIAVVLLVQRVAQRQREAEARRLEREAVAEGRERLARLGMLAAGVAHTVRNPLHGLLNCVDLLKGRVAPSDVELIEAMDEGIARIEHVTRRLLLLARERPAAREPVAVRALVDDALRFVRVRSQDHAIGVDVDLDQLPEVDVDPVRLSEALAAILDNAFYACRLGGRVVVRAHHEPEARQVVLQVVDTGEGIEPTTLGHVLDPFFTSKPIGEGTGLGLPIAKQALDDVGGRLSLSSRRGEGTTVTLTLPTTGASRG